MITRTDRLLEAMAAEIERHRKALDVDDTTTHITVSVRLNEGGVPCLVEMERRSRKELTRGIHR